MAFRERMHERNIYKVPPDFKKLSEDFPDLQKHVLVNDRGKIRIDFKDINSLRALTRVLLLKDFNLDVRIPEGFLVPTVPQRLNYILWIEDLLSEFSASNDVKMTSVQGIDIGTGPSCILALLGARKNNWSYLATECSEESVTCALENVEKNNLQNKIEVLKVDNDSCLKDIIASKGQVYDFCVCNPPFFENIEEITKKEGFGISIHKKAKSNEIITNGGEISFVKKIISDSLVLKEKVRLYTSMLGKKKSFKEIKALLSDFKDITFTSVEFFQGNTVRWGIAWTFSKTIFKTKTKSKPPKKHQPLSFVILKKSEQSTVNEIVKKLQQIFTEFKIDYRINTNYKGYAEIILQSDVNTWTRQRKKRRELERNKKNSSTSSNEETNRSESLSKTCLSDSANEHLDMSSKITKEELCSVSEDKKPEVCTIKQELKSNPSNEIKEGKPVLPQSVKHSIEAEQSNITTCKKLKRDLDFDCKAGVSSNSNFKENTNLLLHCIVKLMKTEDSFILEMDCPQGSNRDSMYQLFLLFKNKF